jgi:hypothetical protein
VPDTTPFEKVTPAGSAPVSETVGAGNPLAVTGKLPATPALNVVWLAEVIAGLDATVQVKDTVAGSTADELAGVTVTE